MIKVICLGKIKESYLTDLINDYQNRICKYTKFNIIELKDTNDLAAESNDILKYIDHKDYVIACVIEGDSLSSEKLAKTIDEAYNHFSNVTFVIGSSNGLDNKIKERANLKLSFSKMTLPHGLFRGVLLEQIYRSLKINNHETYHK